MFSQAYSVVGAVDGNVGFCDEEGIGEFGNFDNEFAVGGEGSVEDGVEHVGRLYIEEDNLRSLVEVDWVGDVFFIFVGVQIGVRRA